MSRGAASVADALTMRCRVLTVVPARQRINTIIAAHQQHTKSLVPAGLCLFGDRRGLLGAEDLFAYPWSDAAGESHQLLD